MSINTILVPVSGFAATCPALDVGLELGRRVEAHVEAYHVSLDSRDSVAFLGEGMTGAMIEEIMAITEREAGERGGRARALFDEKCGLCEVPILDPGAPPARGFSAVYLTTTGREEEHVARRGRLADLIVLNQPTQADTSPPSSATFEAALRDTGRPVVVVPPETSPGFGGRVAVAWNGSVEAARAIAAALPLLDRAEGVLVLSVGEEGKPGGLARDVVDYLGWHGIGADAETVKATPRSVGASLLGAAADAGADFMVMGAYTHSRLHRLIFGGATREVLANAKIPVLMSH